MTFSTVYRLCIASFPGIIALHQCQHHPYIGRCDWCCVPNPTRPLSHFKRANVSTAIMLCIALPHARSHSHLHYIWALQSASATHCIRLTTQVHSFSVQICSLLLLLHPIATNNNEIRRRSHNSKASLALNSPIPLTQLTANSLHNALLSHLNPTTTSSARLLAISTVYSTFTTYATVLLAVLSNQQNIQRRWSPFFTLLQPSTIAAGLYPLSSLHLLAPEPAGHLSPAFAVRPLLLF